ncbi:MAG: TfoX/Sxy family protein [Calditrichaeota bacterium]|nr:TfoX/Sxy family protein [Calditrichota bacterium]
MPPKSEFVAHLLELMESAGPVRSRPMFGGYGIYLNDRMFGLVAEKVLYLKTDEQNRELFREKNLGPFVYLKAGKPTETSYCQAPEEALEDPDEMRRWVTVGYEAALRFAAKKTNRKK